MNRRLHIALIDDDAAVLDSLRLYFSRQEIDAAAFSAAAVFLAAVRDGVRYDCVVSDVRMPGLDGLDLVRRLKADKNSAPIVLITGHGDIDMAVSAIKLGAFDFIEKPFDESRLLASIRNAVEQSGAGDVDERRLDELRARADTLSTRQRQVMELAVKGFSNKEIGAQLNISPKTVENHRAWVMERMGARNVAELVRIAMRVEGRS